MQAKRDPAFKTLPVADPGFANGGAKVQRRRRKDRGAEGAEGGWVWEGGIPLPNGEGAGEGHCPSRENFSILSLKMATFSAFWALFLQFIVHSSIDCL